jgi:hypothetical protein
MKTKKLPTIILAALASGMFSQAACAVEEAVLSQETSVMVALQPAHLMTAFKSVPLSKSWGSYTGQALTLASFPGAASGMAVGYVMKTVTPYLTAMGEKPSMQDASAARQRFPKHTLRFAGMLFPVFGPTAALLVEVVSHQGLTLYLPEASTSPIGKSKIVGKQS